MKVPQVPPIPVDDPDEALEIALDEVHDVLTDDTLSGVELQERLLEIARIYGGLTHVRPMPGKDWGTA